MKNSFFDLETPFLKRCQAIHKKESRKTLESVCKKYSSAYFTALVKLEIVYWSCFLTLTKVNDLSHFSFLCSFRYVIFFETKTFSSGLFWLGLRYISLVKKVANLTLFWHEKHQIHLLSDFYQFFSLVNFGSKMFITSNANTNSPFITFTFMLKFYRIDSQFST